MRAQITWGQCIVVVLLICAADQGGFPGRRHGPTSHLGTDTLPPGATAGDQHLGEELFKPTSSHKAPIASIRPWAHPPSQSSNPITPTWGRQAGPAWCGPQRKSPEPGAAVLSVARQGLGAPGSPLLLPSQVERRLSLFPLEGPEQAKRGSD